MDEETWQVYLVECADHTLYCGVTKDTERRVAQHNGEKRGGARYTRSRRPVRLVAERSCRSHSEALRLECIVKRMRRGAKIPFLLNGITDKS